MLFLDVLISNQWFIEFLRKHFSCLDQLEVCVFSDWVSSANSSPYPNHYSSAFASSSIPYLLSLPFPLRSRYHSISIFHFHVWGLSGLPCFVYWTLNNLLRYLLSPDWTTDGKAVKTQYRLLSASPFGMAYHYLSPRNMLRGLPQVH